MAQSTLPQTPEQRIKALEQELAETKLKAKFFEAVVNVLKTDYVLQKSRKRSYPTKNSESFIC